MKKYTQDEAIQEIFTKNKTPLSAKLLVYKQRYKEKKLSQKTIDLILEQFNFIVLRPIIYGKKPKTKKRRYPHIQKTKYVSIEIDVKTYNRVVRVTTVADGGTSDIEVNKWFMKRLSQPNDFVRLKCMEYYIDIHMTGFKQVGNIIVVSLGDIIDTNNQSRIILKKE